MKTASKSIDREPDADPRLRTGYQIAVHNPAYLHKPGSWMYAGIRMATGSYWNHWAGIVVSDRGPLVVEMRGRGRKRGIRKTSLIIWLFRHPDRKYEILPVECTPEQIERMVTCKGIGYDFWSLLIWQPLYIIFGVWLEPKFLRSKPYHTCSEFYATLLEKPNAHRMSPGDMAILCGASRK